MIDIPAESAAAILLVAVCAGCATKSPLAPFPARGSAKVVQHAADVLIQGVSYTRASSREVAGWCWNEKATDKLAYVARAGVGNYEGVEVILPTDPRGTHYVSCSWHTHPWGSHVAPGPRMLFRICHNRRYDPVCQKRLLRSLVDPGLVVGTGRIVPIADIKSVDGSVATSACVQSAHAGIIGLPPELCGDAPAGGDDLVHPFHPPPLDRRRYGKSPGNISGAVVE
jgi:hypothetical protein